MAFMEEIPAAGGQNHLAAESSPYLLAHASNPVDWYPWGPAALERAKALDRPIFLSIGYHACHWCHVMERESFEDPITARFLNEHFVSIKVDREERPDLDHVYQTYLQLTGRSGGWPLSVFLTPALTPIAGGTYFPPVRKYGMASFLEILMRVVEVYTTRREVVEQEGEKTISVLAEVLARAPAADAGFLAGLDRGTLTTLARDLAEDLDDLGGWGTAPKFPNFPLHLFLLRQAALTRDGGLTTSVLRSLAQMARGGIFDHLGGGFARYSTDRAWLVPHFEKMLYDNALALETYAEAYAASGDPFFRHVVEATLAFLMREMRAPTGGFIAALDADSEGVEGKYYVWDYAELKERLGPTELRYLEDHYGVTPGGNFEGHNILHLPGDWGALSPKTTAAVFAKLEAVRSARVRPNEDYKQITAWNALLASGLIAVQRVLPDPTLRTTIDDLMRFLTTTMRRPDGGYARVYTERGGAALQAGLEDLAYLAKALVDYFYLTGDGDPLVQAAALMRRLQEDFRSSEATYRITAVGQEPVAGLGATTFGDTPLPNPNAVAWQVGWTLHKLVGDRAPVGSVVLDNLLSVIGQKALPSPEMHGTTLLALQRAVEGTVDFVAVDPAPGTAQALAALPYLPLGTRLTVTKATPPLFMDAPVEYIRVMAGGPADRVYACRGVTCSAPLAGAAALQAYWRETFA